MLLSAVALVLASCSYEDERWRNFELKPPCEVLEGVAGDERQARLQKEYGWSAEASRICMSAIASRDEEEARGGWDNWANCAAAAPNALASWVGLLGSYYRRGWKHRPAEIDELRKLFAGATNRPALAVALLKGGSAFPGLFARGLSEEDPSKISWLIREPVTDREDALGWGMWLLDQAAAKKVTLSKKDHTHLAHKVLRASLLLNLPSLTTSIWKALPPPLKDSVRAEATDISTEVALSLLAENELAEARTLFVPGPNQGFREDCKVDLREAILSLALLKKRRAEPYEAMVAVRTCRIDRTLLPLLPPLVTERYRSNLEVGWWTRRLEEMVPVKISEHVVFPEQKKRLEAALAAEISRLNRFDASLAVAEVAIDAGFGRQLPKLKSPFAERARPGRPGKAVAIDSPSSVPPSFDVVRAEKVKGWTVVLATSHRLDPAGEATRGAYWILLSKDGTRWAEPIYTGLRVHRPYVAAEASKVPLFDGAVLRIEADAAELDETSISFPPVATRVLGVRSGLMLEAKLGALTADTDGDGLPDLVEDRLLLDPANVDSDADGIPDGDDATPRLKNGLLPSPSAALLNAFFEERRVEETPPALVTSPRNTTGKSVGVAPDFCGKSVRKSLEDIVYLIGTPAELAGLSSLARIVTLDPDEYDAAEKRFGSFYPLSVDVIVNPEGDRAYIEWSEQWVGGAFTAKREADGRWVLTELSSWIT